MKKVLMPACMLCMAAFANAQNKEMPPPPPPPPPVAEAPLPAIEPYKGITTSLPAPPPAPPKPPKPNEKIKEGLIAPPPPPQPPAPKKTRRGEVI